MDPGERVWVCGGYAPEPEWLAGGDGYAGVLERFIPGQNREPAAVVRLDAPVRIEGVDVRFLVLELRHVGARWEEGAIVHVEVCSGEPEPTPHAERAHGKWVESHAQLWRRPPTPEDMAEWFKRQMERSPALSKGKPPTADEIAERLKHRPPRR